MDDRYRHMKDALTLPEVINQLKDLAADRKTFFTNDGDDEIFRQDYLALLKAVELLEELK